MECPHKQEVFQSGLSSASYDSVHYIESLEHQAVKLHTTHTTAVITTASVLLRELNVDSFESADKNRGGKRVTLQISFN